MYKPFYQKWIKKSGNFSLKMPVNLANVLYRGMAGDEDLRRMKNWENSSCLFMLTSICYMNYKQFIRYFFTKGINFIRV